MSVGRNEPCPCGSGKKYKSCCVGKESQRSNTRGLVVIIIAIVAVAAIGFIPMVIGEKEVTKAAALPVAPVATPKAQPPGPVPEGKVWSTEHGHWHDTKPNAASSGIQVEASGGGAAFATTSATPRPAQPPAGAAPPGKVWSAEHGHYHSAAGATRPPSPFPSSDPSAVRVLGQKIPSTPPPGPAPAGKVWSPEHRHYH